MFTGGKKVMLDAELKKAYIKEQKFHEEQMQYTIKKVCELVDDT
jgi:hypothetical protein